MLHADICENKYSVFFVYKQDFLQSYTASEFRMFCLLTKYRSGQRNNGMSVFLLKDKFGIFDLRAHSNSAQLIVPPLLSSAALH